jgi:hypothetical protein
VKAVLIAVLALALPAVSGETTLGAGVTVKDATPIADIAARPQEFVGKTVRIDGVATAVCTEMGCWMAVAASDKPDGPTVRLKVEHEGSIVFPVTAKGKQVSAQGVFEAIGAADEHAREAAGEHAAMDHAASQQFQISATGAVIRQ